MINTAAASYTWENVADYDFVFRHLMAENRQHSWAKTYMQMWNLALRDPVSGGGNNGVNGCNNATPVSNWHDRCCWKFNKNKCNDKNCSYDHRCMYCGRWGHSAQNSFKKNGNKNGNKTVGNQRRENNNSSPNIRRHHKQSPKHDRN